MKRSLTETKTKKKVNKSNTCESFITVNKNFSNILDEVNVHSTNYDGNYNEMSKIDVVDDELKEKLIVVIGQLL